MKIFQNKASGNGGGSSDSSIEPGMIIRSITPLDSDGKYFNITQSDYLAEQSDTDIVTTIGASFPPELVTYIKTSIYGPLNNEQIHQLSEDEWLFSGYNGLENQFYVVGKVKKGLNPSLISIDLANANNYSSVYDYNDTVYIYRSSSFSNDTDFTNTLIKVNLSTLTSETVNISNRRICKVYFDKLSDNFVSHEYNHVDSADQVSSKSGIFVGSDLENMSSQATFEALANNNDFRNKTLLEGIKNISNKMIYTKDNSFLIYHETEKQLKKYSAGDVSIAIDVLDRNEEKTMVDNCSLILELNEKYFVCYNHKIEESTNKYKAWVNVNSDLTGAVEYCFCENLMTNDNNLGFIVPNVYNYDWGHPELPDTGYAIVYQDTAESTRQVTTFRNSFNYANVSNFYESGYYFMMKEYFKNLNYTAILNNEKQLIIDDFKTILNTGPFDGNIASFAFNGISVPGIYVEKAESSITSNYYLRIKK